MESDMVWINGQNVWDLRTPFRGKKGVALAMKAAAFASILIRSEEDAYAITKVGRGPQITPRIEGDDDGYSYGRTVSS